MFLAQYRDVIFRHKFSKSNTNIMFSDSPTIRSHIFIITFFGSIFLFIKLMQKRASIKI